MKPLRLCFYLLLSATAGFAQASSEQLQSVNFSKVKINDQFWSPKMDKVSTAAVPVCIEQSEVKTGRIRNFERVARKKGEKHEGIYYDDSDVYKALEAIAYSLKNHPDKTIEAKADEWIDKIAAAQEPDGYLNTYYSLTGLDKRWTDMEKHEDYCAGHLMEAAVAYYNTTGKRKILDVAIRLADHIDNTFRLKDRHWVTGHQEIELALVKLANATGNKKYTDLADWLLQQRGHGYGKGAIWTNPHMGAEYCQDDAPVKDQREIKGHAVRAMYLYTGAADVGAAKQDMGYMNAMNSIWEDVVYRNMYITGGIGSSGSNEGFSTDYDLPNKSAYCETCASVGMVFWNQRMNLLTKDAKFIDVLERSLYNGALSGISLSGDRFFYGNPLAADGNYGRSEWFGTACCPSNISRLIASLGNYIYASSEHALWVNLFAGSEAQVQLGKKSVQLSQQTNYPWNGRVVLSVNPQQKSKFAVNIRIPGWATESPVPGMTYSYVNKTDSAISILVNGKAIKYELNAGYAVISRDWTKGDKIELNLPMPVRQIKAIDQVKANENRIALQRGPLVYCVEEPDNIGNTQNFIVPENTSFSTGFQKDLLGGVVTIKATVPAYNGAADGNSIETKQSVITAIPYYSWANRGKSKMQVWLPAKVGTVTVDPGYKLNQ